MCRNLGPAAGRLTEGDVGKTAVLAGVLRAVPASGEQDAEGHPLVATSLPREAERIERSLAGAQTYQRAGLAVACDGAQVVSVEVPQVLVGSREWVASSRGVPEAASVVGVISLDPPTVADRAVRVLCEGDAVIARGTVRAVPADAPGRHYREASAAHVLVPPPGGFVEVAYAGAPAGPRGLGRVRAPVITAVAAWLILLGAVRVAPRVRNAVYRATHPCPQDLELALTQGDPASASRRAEACGDWVQAARGAWQVADFERASAAFLQAHAAGLTVPPSLSETAAHLLAGRYLDSAVAARALAEDGPIASPSSQVILECYADALDARSGDPQARERLSRRAREDGQAPAPCALLAADALKGAERTAFLRTEFHPQPPGRWVAGGYGTSLDGPAAMDDYASVLLDGEEGGTQWNPRPPEWYPLHGLRGLRYYVLDRPLGLEQTRRGSTPDLEAEDALTFAAFASYLGDHAEAAKEYRRALVAAGLLDPRLDPGPGGLFDYRPPAGGSREAVGFEANRRSHRRLLFLGATLAARAREAGNARVLAAMAPEETHGGAMLDPFLAVLSPRTNAPDAERQQAFARIASAETWEPSQKLWSLAARGDSAFIPAEMRARGLDGRGVIPYVGPDSSAPEAFRSFVASAYPPPCWTCGPHLLVDWVAGRREAAQALGMKELDASLAEVAARLHAAFVRRDVSVLLYALGRAADR